MEIRRFIMRYVDTHLGLGKYGSLLGIIRNWRMLYNETLGYFVSDEIMTQTLQVSLSFKMVISF